MYTHTYTTNSCFYRCTKESTTYCTCIATCTNTKYVDYNTRYVYNFV